MMWRERDGEDKLAISGRFSKSRTERHITDHHFLDGDRKRVEREIADKEAESEKMKMEV